jgi:hypothetical protein
MWNEKAAIIDAKSEGDGECVFYGDVRGGRVTAINMLGLIQYKPKIPTRLLVFCSFKFPF